MKIKELLLRDPSLPIVNEGVANIPEKSGEAEMRALRAELEMFVCEGRFKDAVVRILDQYIGGLDNNAQKAAWVSGFYGSGKSHLLKMLTHLWANTKFADGADARGIAHLPEEIKAQLRELDVRGLRSGAGTLAAAGTMLGGNDAVRQTVLAILLRALDLPTDFVRAQFCLHLYRNGWLSQVTEAVTGAGANWDEELSSLYVSPHIANAVMAVTPNFGADANQVRNAIKLQFPRPSGDIELEAFTAVAIEALRMRGEGHLPCTLLVLDEVQQYVGTSTDRATRLTAVIQALAQQFGSRVFVVASGQSALAAQTPHIGYLDGRFPIKIKLEEHDVATVIRKVLLKKRPEALPALGALVDRHSGEISRQLSDTKIHPTAAERDDLVADYPLLPVRRRFWDHAFRALDEAGTNGALRSSLRIVRDALDDIADADFATTIAADSLYEELAPHLVDTGVLARETQEAIAGLDGLERRAAAAVFLVGRLDRSTPATDIGVRPTASHLGDLLVTDLQGDSIAFRKKVEAVLEELRNSGTLMRTGSEYGLETTEGREWRQALQRERIALGQDPVTTTSKRLEAVRAGVQRAGQSVRVVPQGAEQRVVDYRYDSSAPVADDKVVIWVRGAWDVATGDYKSGARAAGPDSAIVHVLVPAPAGEALQNAIIGREAAIATLGKMPAGASPAAGSARKATETLRDEASREVTRIVDEIVGRASVALGGGTTISGATFADRIRDAGSRAAMRQFHRFAPANHPRWADAYRAATQGAAGPLAPVGHTGPTEAHAVCAEVLARVGANASGTQVRNALKAPPYGWPQDAIDAALVALVRANILGVTINGEAKGGADLAQNRIGTAQFRRVSIVIDGPKRIILRTLYAHADVLCAAGQEDDGAKAFLDAMGALARAVGGNTPLPAVPTIPAVQGAHAQTGLERLQALLDAHDDLVTTIDRWKVAGALAATRTPMWQDAIALEPHARALPDLGEAVAQLDAIRAQRSLLDPNLHLDTIVQNLAGGLREALTTAHEAVEHAATAARGAVVASTVWQALPEADRDALLTDANLDAPAVPLVTTPGAVARALQVRPLAGWRDLAQALPTRATAVLEQAAKAAAPMATRVQVDRHEVLKDEADVEAWIMRQWERLSAAVAHGPAIVD